MAVNADRNPLTHFGRQVRKERLARGWSLREFAVRTGMAAGYWSQIENGKRGPTERVARVCDAAFPERRGWFLEYYEESRTWTPPGFKDWREYEDRAVTLRAWSPTVLHGLVQTEDYARELLLTVPGVTDEQVNARLKSRMERQRRVLLRDDPPTVWLVVDALSLYREVGSPETMASQMQHLAEIATLPHVTMQVLPAVAIPVSSSELIVTDGAAYVEHLTGGLVYTDETITPLLRLFNTIQGESCRVSESLKMFERLGNLWTGGKAPTPTLRVARALKSRRRKA